jgi:cell division protein FtsI/penicillin-binding protein 2
MKRIGRIRFISICILLFTGVLLVKLYLLQIVHSSMYRTMAEHQYVRPGQTIFDRGTIYFTNKDGSLFSAATVQSGFTIILNPIVIQGITASSTKTGAATTTQAELIYEKLSGIIKLDHDTFMAQASKNDQYEVIADQVPTAIGQKISALGLKGVTVALDKWRYYPGDDLAAHVLGFVGYQGDTLTGQYGLEKYYDQTLTKQGSGNYVNFFAEIFSDIKDATTDNSNLEGDIITTIEPNVQAYLQKEVQGVMDQWHSDFTGAMVMDPYTGEIVAMASNPSFDPNSYSASALSSFTNPMVQQVREMGSIVKPLTMAAGLDSGAVSTTTTYNDTGFIMVNGSKISNYDGKARGVIPMQQILNQSLNVGASWVATQTGTTTFAKYFKAYGLGEKTGIDLPNEATGLIGNLNSPRQVEYDTASFGQGIAITPLETVRALSSLGNGGYLPCPHIVKKIRYDIGVTKDISCPKGRQVISPKTSQTITQMLVTVVDKALVNGTAMMPHYEIAAKTGTAQISMGGGQGYYADRYLHSFFAYFPADHPRYIVFFYTYYPKGAEYASNTLTTYVFNTIKYLINYYNIPPDR